MLPNSKHTLPLDKVNKNSLQRQQRPFRFYLILLFGSLIAHSIYIWIELLFLRECTYNAYRVTYTQIFKVVHCFFFVIETQQAPCSKITNKKNSSLKMWTESETFFAGINAHPSGIKFLYGGHVAMYTIKVCTNHQRTKMTRT